MNYNNVEKFTTTSNEALGIATAIAADEPIDLTIAALILRLQTTLNVSQLIHIFFNTLKDGLLAQGIRYEYPLLDQNIFIGNKAKISLAYLLEIEGESWGRLVIYRNDNLNDELKAKMDKYISAVIFPLKNAIQYECALIQSNNDKYLCLPNWDHMEFQLNREAKLAIRQKQSLSLVLIDIDRFKNLREKHGSHIGDTIIKHTYELVKNCIRDTDILYRFDYDQFALIFSDIQEFSASLIAERARIEIADQQMKLENGKKIRLTISAGITELRMDDSIESIYNRAVSALKLAKNSGRNQVKVADGQLVS